MRMGVGKNGELVIEGDILEYAKELLKRKEYFGAFACLHALIEAWMEELFEREYAKRHRLKEARDRSLKGYRYGRLKEDLLKHRLISADEAKAVEGFDDLRHRVVHRIVKFQFRPKEHYRVRETEVINGFNRGVELVGLLKAKCEGQFSTTVLLDESGKGTVTVPQQAKTLGYVRVRIEDPKPPPEALARLEDRIGFVKSDIDKVRKFPPAVAKYHSQAVSSFLAGDFAGSISASSAAVEVAINYDLRMKELREERHEWLGLTHDVLKFARARGLPVDRLLIEGDNVDQEEVWFVIRRDKFESGEVYRSAGPVPLPMLIEKKGDKTLVRTSLRPETMPLQQLISAHEFLMSLYSH